MRAKGLMCVETGVPDDFFVDQTLPGINSEGKFGIGWFLHLDEGHSSLS